MAALQKSNNSICFTSLFKDNILLDVLSWIADAATGGFSFLWDDWAKK